MLSANAEYPVKAEQLHDETDLNTKITRYRTIRRIVFSLLWLAWLRSVISLFCFLFFISALLSFLSPSFSLFIPSLHPFLIAMLLSFSHHPITPSLFSPLLRVEFEAACEDLFERLTAPIDAALKMAGKTLSEVHSVELLG